MVFLLISIVKYPHSLESGISLSKSRLSLKNERRLLGYLQQRNKNTQKDKKCAKKYSRMRKAYFFKKHGNMQNIIALFSFATQRCAKSFRYFGRKPGETADYEKVPASCKKAENIFNTGGIGAL